MKDSEFFEIVKGWTERKDNYKTDYVTVELNLLAGIATELREIRKILDGRLIRT